MAQNVNPVFTRVPKNIVALITAADTTSSITAFTADATEGGAVITLGACSFDSANMTLVVSINDGVTSRVIGSVLVPANSGTDGLVPGTNIFTKENIPSLQDDGSYILEAGHTLEVNALVTVTGNVDVTGIAGNY